MAGKGILLNSENGFKIVGGKLQIGDTEIQETAIILEMNQGDLKPFPTLGPNLVNMIRGKEDPLRLQRQVRIHLAMDNKSYDAIKDKIKING